MAEQQNQTPQEKPKTAPTPPPLSEDELELQALEKRMGREGVTSDLADQAKILRNKIKTAKEVKKS